MPHVFTGKVTIPGDKIEQVLEAAKDFEKAREPFRQHLTSLNEEFAGYLSARYSPRTARKHSGIVEMLVEFLGNYTDVATIEEITRGMANTHFRQWYKRKVWDSATPDDLRVALKRFFQFLETEKGIHNPKVLESFR
jgi:hypothetical protein